MSQKQFPPHKLPQFVLTPLSKDPTLPSFQIDYQQMLRDGQTVDSIIPIFNLDKLYYTPSFVLPIDVNYYVQNQVYQRCQFQDKIQHELQPFVIPQTQRDSERIKMAVPQNHYCQICKQQFSEYDLHIGQKKHVQGSQYNSTNERIKQLCAMFDTKTGKVTANMKKKAIAKTETSWTLKRQSSRKSKASIKLSKTSCNNKGLKATCNTSSSEANELRIAK